MGTWPEGHSGPILNHMASCGGATCTGVDATTLDWFAIHHSGYDATAKIWPTDVLATTGAKHTITLPTDLPGGAYLLRFELIAMHSVPAQFYPWAAEIDLTSSGTSLPSSEYMGKFPDMYSAAANNMALDFSLYTGNDLMSFVLPGVPVYPGGSSKGNDPRPDGSAGPAPGNATVPAPDPASSTASEAVPAPTKATGTEPAASASATASETASDPLAEPSATSAAEETTEAAPAIPTMTGAEPAVPTTSDSATEDQEQPTDSQALPAETGSGSQPAQPEPTQTGGAPSSVVPIPITIGTAEEESATTEPTATQIAEPQPEPTTTAAGEVQPDVPAPTASATASASGFVVEPSQMVPTDPVTEIASSTAQAAEPT
ncbi:hypothetical protein FFLO_01387 [Filobasidium floriforme]|uniref:lytic cellulose monooxygenase (C4-dehydrogenating) n=1 Tax=Filobasidium floriforme TaxID=5210 RepID=A0A8K0JQU4_9TREE|nr:hypothetical protein FFLO_01387 [Filobasidium floriforme]